MSLANGTPSQHAERPSRCPHNPWIDCECIFRDERWCFFITSLSSRCRHPSIHHVRQKSCWSSALSLLECPFASSRMGYCYHWKKVDLRKILTSLLAQIPLAVFSPGRPYPRLIPYWTYMYIYTIMLVNEFHLSVLPEESLTLASLEVK